METVDWSEIPLETAMNFWRAALGSDWVHHREAASHYRLWVRLKNADVVEYTFIGEETHWKIKEPTCHT
jgi:hypothetical protein